MAKRKNEAPANGKPKKKRAISDDEAHKNFRSGLFDSKVLEEYTSEYAGSQPYASISACAIQKVLIELIATSTP
jgi:hypothetical protein